MAAASHKLDLPILCHPHTKHRRDDGQQRGTVVNDGGGGVGSFAVDTPPIDGPMMMSGGPALERVGGGSTVKNTTGTF